MSEESHAVRPSSVVDEERVQGNDGDGEEDGEMEGSVKIDEEQFGERRTIKVKDPCEPSAEEVAEHCLTHLPFRSWCRFCCRGRGIEMPHRRKAEGEERLLPEVHFDFCFLGNEGKKDEVGETLPVLVVREVATKMTMSAAVPSKSTGTFIARRVVAFLKEIGLAQCDMIVKSDQEPAITSIVAEVGRVRAAAGGGRYIVETSPVGSSGSNGIVERAIRSVEQQVRVMRDALEHRAAIKLTARHPLMPWVVEYAGYLLSRFEVSHDGKTSYERCKGKRAKTLGVEFGESILWKRKPVGGSLAKAVCLWEDGIFLGVRGASGEIIVGDARGVWKTRSIQRKPLKERWKDGCIEVVKHVPWRVSDEDPNVDGEKLMVEDAGRKLPDVQVELEREIVVMPNRFTIRKEDLERHGYSAGCQGCKALLRGTARQGHSEACRKRLEGELKDDPRMKLQKARQEEYVARRLEEQERKRRKQQEEKKDEPKQNSSSSIAAAPSSSSPAASSSSSSCAAAAASQQEPPARPDAFEDVEMRETGEKRVSWEELARRVKGRISGVECLEPAEGHPNSAKLTPQKGHFCQHQGGGVAIDNPPCQHQGGGGCY
jgi:hypothetical protein